MQMSCILLNTETINREVLLHADTDVRETLQRCIEYHGHYCPGQSLGVRNAKEGLELVVFTGRREGPFVFIGKRPAASADAVLNGDRRPFWGGEKPQVCWLRKNGLRPSSIEQRISHGGSGLTPGEKRKKTEDLIAERVCSDLAGMEELSGLEEGQDSLKQEDLPGNPEDRYLRRMRRKGVRRQ